MGGGGQNFKILNLDIFGFFRKMNILLGMKILRIIFLGHHKIGLYLGAISTNLGSFLKIKVQNGGYVLGC